MSLVLCEAVVVFVGVFVVLFVVVGVVCLV